MRLGLSVELPGGTGLLVDFSGIHPTVVSCLNKLETFVEALGLGDNVSSTSLAVSARLPSPAVEAAAKTQEAR